MKHTDEERDDSAAMADDIVDAVTEEDSDDGLGKSERVVEQSKEADRVRKAKELRKQLRRRELGFLNYRWPTVILIVSGIFSIMTQYLPVMTHPEELGYDTFTEMFFLGGGPFFLFPLASGVLFIILGILSYNDPKWPYVSIIPGLMMAMAGATVLFQITFLNTLAYELGLIEIGETSVFATGIPWQMLLTTVLAFMAVFLREKE